jgi:hypothetical protein
MITFSNLGKYGKLGNQLFQISAVYCHAVKNNMGYIFPEWKYNEYLDKKIATGNLPSGLFQYRERDPFSYFPIPVRDNMDLYGYFQNENYLSGMENEIRDLFNPSPSIRSIVDEFKSKYDGFTAIHVRRGDYLNFPLHHPIPSIDYYNRAIDITREYSKGFIVFSDDIDWCKNNFTGEFEFSEENDEFVDLMKMSSCSNFIIANSSFSWWGSFLSRNNDKKVFAPDNWVGRGYSGTGWRQVYRKEMTII